MMHWIIAPVILPAMLAPIIAYVMRHDITLARVGSFAGVLGLLGLAIGLFVMASGGETFVYRLGDWPAPFGIVLVLDRLSALMVLLTAILALVVLYHVVATDWDKRGRHFHALYQFQLMGIVGAFLTGDAFNLFVFFEVLLIASYGLMIHAGGKIRLKAGLQYVVMNLAGSTLFLFALGTLYASTGTLNIADMAVKIAQVPVEDAAIVRVAGILLLFVFAVKAALFPVQFWLPATYSNAPAPVAALFAIMTKVGAYAILRIHTIAFGPEAGAIGDMVTAWLIPMAALTLAVGAIGVFGAKRLEHLIAYAVIGSMGTMMLAVAAMTPAAASAAIYYMLNSTLAAAALFLFADIYLSRRGEDGRLILAAPLAQNGLFAAAFFAAGIAMVGMPPLSGFLGKLLILEALADGPHITLAFSAILIGSLVMILGFVRAGSILFWKSVTVAPDPDAEAAPPVTLSQGAGMGALVALLVGLTLFAGPIYDAGAAAADQLFFPQGYIEAVLAPHGEG